MKLKKYTFTKKKSKEIAIAFFVSGPTPQASDGLK